MSKAFRSHQISFRQFLNSYDKPLILAILALATFGIVAVFNSSVVSAYRDFGDQYHYVKDQALYLVVGVVLMFLVASIDYHRWYKLAIPLLVTTLILLLVVFIPGIGVTALGAKRWVNFGFFILQPTELAKLALVIYLSAWFTFKERGRLFPFLIFLSMVVGLIILQPDLGTAVIITAIAGVLYFISGVPLTHVFVLIPLVIIGIGFLAIAAPYRLIRITTYLNPDVDPLGSSYHIRQILLALGSGGLFGLGLGKSRQKYEYLPEANTDSIFAIIAEEIGFFGSLLLILGFVLVIYRAYIISRRAPDRFGQLLSMGICIWFAFQTIINLSSMVALLPLTGVPLPLISYGGSSLISLLIGFGILLNIGRQANLRPLKRTSKT